MVFQATEPDSFGVFGPLDEASYHDVGHRLVAEARLRFSDRKSLLRVLQRVRALYHYQWETVARVVAAVISPDDPALTDAERALVRAAHRTHPKKTRARRAKAPKKTPEKTAKKPARKASSTPTK